MQEQRIERFARFMAHLVPDAITAAVVLTGLTGVLALILGNPFGAGNGGVSPGLVDAAAVHDADDPDHRAQLGARRPRRSSGEPSRRWRGFRRRATRSSCWRSCRRGTSYLYWGLGYALSPMIAIYFAARSRAQGDPDRFPVSAGRDHGGAGALAVRVFVERAAAGGQPRATFCRSTIGVVPLSTTIWSPAAIIHEVRFPRRRHFGRRAG